MARKYYFIVAAIITVAGLIYFLSRQTISPPAEDEQMAVTCANKTVFRYKYPSKIFPVLISDYSTNFRIVSAVLNSLAADSSGGSSVSAEAKNSARQLRDTLNQDNIFFENTLKAYFLASNNDPCNDSLRYMYTAYIREMTEKVIQLKQFVAQVATPPASNNTVGNVTVDSVLAVVDTAKGEVKNNTKSVDFDQLIIKKDYRKINSAIDDLQSGYKGAAVRIRPGSLRLQP